VTLQEILDRLLIFKGEFFLVLIYNLHALTVLSSAVFAGPEQETKRKIRTMNLK